MDIYTNLSAMNAFSQGVHITAHNIANVSTDNFESQQFTYGSNGANTVEVQLKDTFPPQGTLPLPEQSPLQDTPPGIINNTVELPRQFAQQISAQHAFEANAVAIRTQDEMMQNLYNQVNGPALVSHTV